MLPPGASLKTLLRVCASLLFLSCAGSLHAQLIACSMKGTDEEFKVYLDDVRAKPNTPVPQRLRQRLKSLAQTLQDNLSVAVSDRAALKRCSNRFPQDISDFNNQIDSLDHMRVVLEIWGELGGTDGKDGELGFVLVPARSMLNPAVFVVKDDFSGPMLQLVKKYIELGAFVPVVLGTNLYQIGQFEDSVSPLCEGQKKLEVALAKLPPNPAPDQKSLAEHEKQLLGKVRSMVDDALKQAKDSGKPQYKDLLPEADGHFSCPK
jgi:hypothetical protein